MKNILTLKNLGWLVTALVSVMILMAGSSKLLRTDEMVSNFTSMNLLPYLKIVGFLEVVSVLLLIYPKTTLLGAIGLTSLMSAAVVVHLSYMGGTGTLVPLVLGLLSLLAYYLRK
jgi:hypothetical protein